ncbi:MAG: NAD(P)H-dependent oxidoreductase [Rhodoferax sp.]|nr:NAD(P)H-dependent oxidoreductase [Rhodoferax sp.]
MTETSEEAEGIPASVTTLKERIIAADGVILFTPEYNNGIPGVFKEHRRLAVAPLIRHGKGLRQQALRPRRRFTRQFRHPAQPECLALPVLHTLGCQVFAEKRLMVSRAHTLFDAEGKLTDEATAKRLGDLLGAFAGFASH